MTEQHPLEVILLRQVASYLALPMWIMDEGGNLVYYNPPAEELLGRSFDDAGAVRAEELPGLFQISAPDGSPLQPHEFPVMNAWSKQEPRHARVRFEALDGTGHLVEVTALPITGQGDRFLGVLATFWESPD